METFKKPYSMKSVNFRKHAEQANMLSEIEKALKVGNTHALKFCLYYSHDFESYNLPCGVITDPVAPTKLRIQFSIIQTEFKTSQISALLTWLDKNKCTYHALVMNSIEKTHADLKNGKVRHCRKAREFFPHLK